MADLSQDIAAAVSAAYRDSTPLQLTGGGSKVFHGAAPTGTPLILTGHAGIIDYVPNELVLTARAGTPLAEIEQTLAEHRQMLACEPPHFGPGATLGGAVACGFSGPRRAYAGALRDFVLGTRIVNGEGEILQFGGQVMKNVAGFDVSRLMVGARGTLGVLLDISLKVLPQPAAEITLRFECDEAQAIALCARWAGRPIPISATAWLEGGLHLRLSGSETTLGAVRQELGGELMSDGDAFWQALREQTLPFFRLQPGENLWRISLPPAADPLSLSGRSCLEWGGAQRWLASDLPAEAIFDMTRIAGGHASLFRATNHGVWRLDLPAGIVALQRYIKAAFDPRGILNPHHLAGGV